MKKWLLLIMLFLLGNTCKTTSLNSFPPSLFGIDPASWIKVPVQVDISIIVRSSSLSWVKEVRTKVSVINILKGFAVLIAPHGYLSGEVAALYFPRENAEEAWVLLYKFDDLPPYRSPLTLKSATVWLNSLNLSSGSKLDCRFEIIDSNVKRGVFTITAP